jgi:hypothetical protein
MKFTCPRCGRNSEIEEDIGDFPVRCHRCATLLRRKHARSLAGWRGSDSGEEALFAAIDTAKHTRRRGGLRRGMLADMLGARASSDEEEPTVIHAHGLAAKEDTTEAENRRAVLTHETRRAVRHVKARQQRLQRAMLEGSRRALGALSWVGLCLVLLLSVGAIVLRTAGW